MVRQVFLLFTVLIGCQKISNNISVIELECAVPGDFESFRFVRFVSDTTGLIASPEGLQVQDEAGRDYRQLVTPKGCLRVPKDLQEKLVVARPSSNEGYILYPTRIASGSIHSHTMKTHRYNSPISSCKNEIVTSSKQIAWPIDWTSVESSSYDWQLVIQKENGTGFTLKRNAVESLNRDRIDLTALDDGVYQMQILGRQLFSKDKVQTQFDCSLIIDQESPLVSLERDLVRIEGEEEAIIQASPGEPIRIQTKKGIAHDSIFACLRMEGESAESCQFNQLSTGYVTAPQRGNWILRLYASDAAGNRGPSTERKLQVYDSNLVTTLRSLVSQSELAQKAGNFIQSIVLAVKAYEKMQDLGSKAEINSVFPQVRKAILEGVALPPESLIFKNSVVDASSETGFIQDNGLNHFFRANSQKLEAHSMNGEILYTVDFNRLITKPGNKAAFRFCENTEEVLATGDTAIYVFKGRRQRAVWDMGPVVKVGLGSVSQDCQYAVVDVTNEGFQRRSVIMDLGTGETFASPASIFELVGFLNAFDRSQIIVRTVSGMPHILDLKTGSMKDLRTVLNVSEILSIKKAKDGSTGILDNDQRFSLFNRKGELATQLDRVTFMQPSQVSDEFVVISAINWRVQAYYLATDGSSRGSIPIGQGLNWSYLSANKNFVVGLSVGSNIVKIWSRTGNVYDEIFYKGDSISSLRFSENGDLAISSMQATRVIQLQSGLIRRTTPQYFATTGMQFSEDGTELFFKEQGVYNSGGPEGTQSNLVKWNPAEDVVKSYPVPGAPLELKQFPSAGQMRDLQYFSQFGEDFVASTMERDMIGIFRANDLNRPVETYDVNENIFPPNDWLLDVAVDPSGNLIAAASQGGWIYIIDRKKNKKWGFSLQSYPTTIEFDRSGQFLFATDVRLNLLKYSVVFDETKMEYRLVLENTVDEAGSKLAMNRSGDRLAVVGYNALLKVFDSNLRLIHSFDLSPGMFAVGQSVTFSPKDDRIYAGLFDGTWNEIDLKNNQILKVRFSSGATGANNLVVSPNGDQLAFMGGGFVQIAELDAEKVYKRMCSWLAPRLPYVPDLADEDRKLCGAP